MPPNMTQWSTYDHVFHVKDTSSLRNRLYVIYFIGCTPPNTLFKLTRWRNSPRHSANIDAIELLAQHRIVRNLFPEGLAEVVEAVERAPCQLFGDLAGKPTGIGIGSPQPLPTFGDDRPRPGARPSGRRAVVAEGGERAVVGSAAAAEGEVNRGADLFRRRRVRDHDVFDAVALLAAPGLKLDMDPRLDDQLSTAVRHRTVLHILEHRRFGLQPELLHGLGDPDLGPLGRLAEMKKFLVRRIARIDEARA